MATYTENYNLEKPAQSDLYNIDVFNENADKVDEALGDKAENQSLAPIESSATASRNYSVGQQFVYNGLLYEATSAIASGGTITPGSNCARTTVAEELSALNDSLTYENLTSGITNNVTISSRLLMRFMATYTLSIIIPSCSSGLTDICVLPAGSYNPNRSVALSVACDRDVDRVGRQEAILGISGHIFLKRESASSGPIVITGAWYV